MWNITHPFTNTAKRKMQAGKKTVGAWCQICSPYTAEIMAREGFDFLVIDLEHAPTDTAILLELVRAMDGTGVQPFVRAPWNDFVAIKKILDTGVSGVIVPYVNTCEEAEMAVKACKYPPQGIRGMSGSPRAAGYGRQAMEYLKRANDEILVITQVETAMAVENLDAILATEDLDGSLYRPHGFSHVNGLFWRRQPTGSAGSHRCGRTENPGGRESVRLDCRHLGSGESQI